MGKIRNRAARQGGPEYTTRRDITIVLRRLQRGTDFCAEIAGAIALGGWLGVAIAATLRAVTS